MMFRGLPLAALSSRNFVTDGKRSWKEIPRGNDPNPVQQYPKPPSTPLSDSVRGNVGSSKSQTHIKTLDASLKSCKICEESKKTIAEKSKHIEFQILQDEDRDCELSALTGHLDELETEAPSWEDITNDMVGIDIRQMEQQENISRLHQNQMDMSARLNDKEDRINNLRVEFGRGAPAPDQLPPLTQADIEGVESMSNTLTTLRSYPDMCARQLAKQDVRIAKLTVSNDEKSKRISTLEKRVAKKSTKSLRVGLLTNSASIECRVQQRIPHETEPST